ncbi:NAD(P)H-dependent flavin oxidoreductase [Rufibacter hautae]|uniref:Propionate 3-nitronate monooxygenase n=1 Tax=Rufibacter hautae TaxID=2595005 RepID=A0A5B6TCP8_9BACT|nr:nitronate monooxygenase [Rufibacter hautae]KAA3436721.1 nitronate monooxygenase [Rufibacter hautae]
MIHSAVLTKLLKIKYPIIQAPMFGVSSPEMVAAAAKAECLGSLPLGDLPAEKCVDLIRATRRLTTKDFAVNIFVNEIPQLSDELKVKYEEAKRFIEQFAEYQKLDVELPDINEIKLTTYQEQLDAIISEGCNILSFTFGNLDGVSIQRLKSHGVTLMGTCTSVKEALILEQSGIDLICVQGIEAGGHRGTFASDEIPKIGGLSLLAQVYDSVKAPLIYAGGIYNGRTLIAAKALGAEGCQIGSLLLSSVESALNRFEKDRLAVIKENDTVLTKSFSGRYARGIKNAFIEKMEQSGYILPYPYQNKLTNLLRATAKAKENIDFVSIWAGQSTRELSEESTTFILNNLIESVEPIVRG